MAGVDDIPRVLMVGAGARRDYCLEQMVEAILPYVCAVHFASGAQGIDQIIHLREVEGVVGQHLLGIIYYGVELGAGVGVLVIEPVVLGRGLAVAIGVEILLEEGTIV